MLRAIADPDTPIPSTTVSVFHFLFSQVVDMIVDYACTFAAPSQPRRVRVAAFFLLSEVWTRVPAEHVERAENPKRILAALKRGVRDPSEPIQVEAITALFRLLDVFAADLSPYAPFVYKASARNRR